MSAQAKNLERIREAIAQHNRNCPFPVAEIRMCWFEVDRFGMEEVDGIPLVADPALPSGRLRLVCGNADHSAQDAVGVAVSGSTPHQIPTAARAAASPDKARTGAPA